MEPLVLCAQHSGTALAQIVSRWHEGRWQDALFDFTALYRLPLLVLTVVLAALLAYRTGDFQDAHNYVTKALQIYPNHIDSKELLTTLQKTFLNN